MRSPTVGLLAVAALTAVALIGCSTPSEDVGANSSPSTTAAEDSAAPDVDPFDGKSIEMVIPQLGQRAPDPPVDRNGNGCTLGFDPSKVEQAAGPPELQAIVPRVAPAAEQIYFETVCDITTFVLLSSGSATPAADQSAKLIGLGYGYCRQHVANPDSREDLLSQAGVPSDIYVAIDAAIEILCPQLSP